ncbi:MAG TPA: hypothetical protein VFX16_00075 [Pseudonocardiaceae bacterium]|nr:hypothetical protein [Pseudonocardiaceae bacterium]
MTEWFTSESQAAHHPWALLTGTEAQRLRSAIRIANQLLGWRTTFADPLT